MCQRSSPAWGHLSHRICDRDATLRWHPAIVIARLGLKVESFRLGIERFGLGRGVSDNLNCSENDGEYSDSTERKAFDHHLEWLSGVCTTVLGWLQLPHAHTSQSRLRNPYGQVTI